MQGSRGKTDLYFSERQTRRFVWNAVSELHSLCLKLTTDKSMTRDFQLFVSNMIKEMKGYKEGIRVCYTLHYSKILLDAPSTKETLKELADSHLEIPKDI